MTVQYYDATGAHDWDRGDELPCGVEFMKNEFVDQFRETAAKFHSVTHNYTYASYFNELENMKGMAYSDILMLFGSVCDRYIDISEHEVWGYNWWGSYGGVLRNSDISEIEGKSTIHAMNGEDTYSAVGLRHVISTRNVFGIPALESPLRFKRKPDDVDYFYSPDSWWLEGIEGAMANHWIFEDMRSLLPALHMIVFPASFYAWQEGTEWGNSKVKNRSVQKREDPDKSYDTGWIESDYYYGGVYVENNGFIEGGIGEYNWRAKIASLGIHLSIEDVPSSFTYHVMVKWDVVAGIDTYCPPRSYQIAKTGQINESNRYLSCPYHDVSGCPMSGTIDYEYSAGTNPDESFWDAITYSPLDDFWIVAEFDSPFREDWI